MESCLNEVDVLLAWMSLHPVIASILGAVAMGVTDRIVRWTPWKADDSLLDIIEGALSSKGK